MSTEPLAPIVHHVPASLRVMLWVCAAATVFVSLVLALAFTAGPTPKEGSTARTFTIAFLCLTGIQIGYLIAPLIAGSRWWAWCFWTTLPFAAILIFTPLSMMFNFMRWTPVDGGSRIPAMTGQLSTVLIGGAIYAGPTVILWFTRPR